MNVTLATKVIISRSCIPISDVMCINIKQLQLQLQLNQIQLTSMIICACAQEEYLVVGTYILYIILYTYTMRLLQFATYTYISNGM
jgi:hypothetical protein